MSNFQTHKEETKAVRAALKAAGINARVGHGRGTSWGWLKLNIGSGQQWGEHVARKSPNYEPCPPECVRCSNLCEMEAEALRISQEVTRQHGDYDGRISILTQDEWSQKRNESIPIPHPNWTTRQPQPLEAAQ